MGSDGVWVNFRKLAAIDIAFLGPKLVIAEFAGGVLICGVLGMFVLFQGGSFTQLVLGVYLIALAINYVPMLIYAISLTRDNGARMELGQELNDKSRLVVKYRRQSLLLLVPLLVPILALKQKRHKLWHRTY
jgi:hypothetical protein